MPIHAVEKLTKIFPSQGTEPECLALEDVTFSMNPGELLVILGQNGAGKSTLLRLIAGLEYPDSGDIRIDQQSVLPIPAHKRNIAMVFQNFSLYPRFTVERNLEMPLLAAGLNEGEMTTRITEVADTLGLLDKLNRKPAELSGGEMQRLAIGRALVRRPALFLLDEPFSHLDSQLRVRMRTEIRQIQHRLAVSTIFVTHDHEEAMGLADRILVLDQGRVLQIGTPEDIYYRPRNSRVAKMLGRPPINLISAEKAAELGIPMGRGRYVGIRPECFRVKSVDDGPGEVKAVENLGPIVVLIIEAKGILLRAVVPNSARAQLGQKVVLSVDPTDLRWFSE